MNLREFVGIDPDGIACLATHSERVADRLIAVARQFDVVLRRHRPSPASVGPQLRAEATQLVEYAAGMRWRASLVARMRDPGSGHLLNGCLLYTSDAADECPAV